MIWEYFGCLREMVQEVQVERDDTNLQRKVLPCVFMSVAIVETFFNMYFRVLAGEAHCSSCSDQTIKDLDENMSLDRKIKTWPKRFFDKEIDLSEGVGQRFMKLKNLRNKLMHFKSTHQTINLPGIQIQGMPDISAYEKLDKTVAVETLTVAEDIIEEIFRMKGMTTDEIKHALHAWIGKMNSEVLNG